VYPLDRSGYLEFQNNYFVYDQVGEEYADLLFAKVNGYRL